MKKSKLAITDDDYRLLMHLWTWKFLSTRMIHQFVYSPRTLAACYQRINLLERHGFISSFVTMDARSWLWQLTDKGYKLLYFEDLKFIQSGFKSEHINHDYWTNVFHLSLIKDVFNHECSSFSEQELRRFDTDSYPEWVPRANQHRPDGWILFNDDNSTDKKLIAIEVELNRKPAKCYSELGQFYSESISVDTVLWLVKTEVEARYILSQLKKGSNRNANEHSFVLQSHFHQSQCHSKIALGKDAGKSLYEVFNKSPRNALETDKGHFYFDLRKNPIKSIINSLNSNRHLRYT